MKRNHKQLLASANTAKKNPLTVLAVAMSISVSMPIVAYAAALNETTTTATAGGSVASDNAYKNVTTKTTGTTSTTSSGTIAGNDGSTPSDFNNPYGIDPNSVPNAADYEGVADASESTAEVPSYVAEQAGVCAKEMQKEVADTAKYQAEVAMITPNTDKVYQGGFSGAAEQTKGCFAGASDFINLATLVPTVPDATGVSAKLNELINKKITDLTDSVMNRACEISNAAINNALEPIRDTIITSNNAILMFNNPNDFVSAAVAKKLGDGFSKVDLGFNKVLDDFESKIINQEKDWAAKAKPLNDKYQAAVSQNNEIISAYQSEVDKLNSQAQQTTGTTVQNVKSRTTSIPASAVNSTVIPNAADTAQPTVDTTSKGFAAQPTVNTTSKGTVTGSTTPNLYDNGTSVRNMYNSN